MREDIEKLQEGDRRKRDRKVIIAEFVLKPEGKGLFDDMGFSFDMLMIAHTYGRERTELEWKKLLNEAGFPRYQVINIPSFLSIIEAYPA